MHASVRPRLIDGLSVGGLDECWEWKRGNLREGYGVIWDNDARRNVLVHRAMLELVKRPNPELSTDHLCRNPACANPRHLERVTRAENTLRGDGPTAVNARKTRCSRGHEFTEENTIVDRRGYRRCRACK